MIFAFIIILNAIMVAYKLKSNLIIILSIILMAYLNGYSDPSYTYDYDSYSFWYNTGSNPLLGQFEFGYMKLGQIFFSAGFSYPFFRFFSSFVAYFAIFVGSKFLVKNTHLVMLFYLVTIFASDVPQVRNLMMYATVMVAFYILTLQVSSKIKYFASVMLIWVASQFQSLALAYYIPLLFTLVPFRYYDKITKAVIITIIPATILIRFTNVFSLVSNITVQVMANSNRAGRADSYRNALENIGNNDSFSLILIGIQILILLFIKQNINFKDNMNGIKYKVLISLVLFGGIASPLLIASISNFERLVRNSWIPFFILIVLYIEHKNTVEREAIRVKTVAYLLLIIVLMPIGVQEFSPSRVANFANIVKMDKILGLTPKSNTVSLR